MADSAVVWDSWVWYQHVFNSFLGLGQWSDLMKSFTKWSMVKSEPLNQMSICGKLRVANSAHSILSKLSF